MYSYSPQNSPVTKSFSQTVPDQQAMHSGGGESKALAKHSSTAYERIRTVGKGSFGIAVLYRRKEDDSFVILKEINLHELSPSERNMALNEVSLLSRLEHPHIIQYFDSFEEDGTLMIEMEYADGGTLAQLLAHRAEGELFPEREVVDIFEQITSAVSYLHDNDILHRDLKTANIFLTNERMVKVGDFGISKQMGTQTLRGGAQTILGTPYYLSPEMCEGKTYNAKSDMWALGCCLYEMCTLRKAFDADNLPTLIHKIVNGEYEPLKGPYSQDVRLTVRDLFRTDPEQRPSAGELLSQIRRKNPLLGTCATQKAKMEGAKQANGASGAHCHSAIYRFDAHQLTVLAMSDLPNRVQIKQLAMSSSHQLVLTADERVYSWGENRHGQLGHGDRRTLAVPQLVQALRGKSVARIAAGKNFSLFCAGKGIAMAAGHRQFVGASEAANDDWLKPKIVDALLKEDIVDVCCGEEHAAVLTEGGGVFVWGMGENGRLGTGTTKQVLTPVRIQIPTRQLINNIVCGPNATMLITNSGTVLAMGSNKHNKLNLNQRPGFFAHSKKHVGTKSAAESSSEVEDVLVPTAVKPFPSRVVSASLGTWHSGVLLENGHVHLFGRNSNGELGIGHTHALPSGCTKPVKAMLQKPCLHLVCCDEFTMVGTVDNELYSWGSKGRQSADWNGNSGGEKKVAQQMPPKVWEVVGKTREGELIRAHPGNMNGKSFIIQPTLVMRLDTCRVGSASAVECGSGEPVERPLIALSSVVGADKRIFCVVDVSSAAAAKKNAQKGTKEPEKDAGEKAHPKRRRRRSCPDAMSLKGAEETWIRNELDDSEIIPYRRMNEPATEKDGEKSLLLSEQRLREEIALLRGQLTEQKSTFRGHERQMSQLQGKLAELQSLLKRQSSGHLSGGLPPVNDPPPAYYSSSSNLLLAGAEKPNTSSKAASRVAVLRNTLLPSQKSTRACAIQ